MRSTDNSTENDGPDPTRQPIHTRSLEIEMRRGKAGKLRLSGTICDLRKQGFLPTGGDLQTSGVIHDMGIQATVDRRSRVLEAIESNQIVVAYEASEATGGESCRDIAWRLRELKGKCLDANFVKKLGLEFGGPLGCSHLLALAQMLPSTLERALAWEDQISGSDGEPRGENEQIFKRSIILDGYEYYDRREIEIVVQLNDVHTNPLLEVEQPLDRFAKQFEVQLWTRINLRDLNFTSMIARERGRDPTTLKRGGWRDVSANLEPLQGQRTLGGLARRVLDLFGENSAAQPLRDTLLAIAPGMIQCMAVSAFHMVEGSAEENAEGPSILQVGGLPDSCYIWRTGGPGQRRRTARWPENGEHKQSETEKDGDE